MNILFLIGALLFPRLTLLFCWSTGSLPLNTTPFALDVALGLIAPRFLVSFWALGLGVHPLWVFFLCLIEVSEVGTGSRVSSRRGRK